MLPTSNFDTPPHKLELTTNSLRNNTMAVDDDSIYYEIVTRPWHPHVTKINRINVKGLEAFTAAEIEHMPGKERTVRLGDEKNMWIAASEFVKLHKQERTWTFVGSSDITYQWKTHRGRLQLVKADDEEHIPLVELHSHKRHLFVFRMSRHAFLEIKPIPEVVRDIERVIVSYLLVERDRRDLKSLFRMKFHGS